MSYFLTIHVFKELIGNAPEEAHDMIQRIFEDYHNRLTMDYLRGIAYTLYLCNKFRRISTSLDEVRRNVPSTKRSFRRNGFRRKGNFDKMVLDEVVLDETSRIRSPGGGVRNNKNIQFINIFYILAN